MNKNSKLAIGFTSIVLAGTLAFGAIASADNGEGSGRRHRLMAEFHGLSDAQKCEKSAEIDTRVATIQQKIADRVVALGELRTEAETAGDTDMVVKIDQRLDRLDKVSTRISEKLGMFDTWVDANCAA